MKAVVSVTLDDEFVIHDIKVIEGEKGLFIAMPSRKANDGEYRDIAHPINSTTRDNIQRLILEKYKAEIENAEQYRRRAVCPPYFSSDAVDSAATELKLKELYLQKMRKQGKMLNKKMRKLWRYE